MLVFGTSPCLSNNYYTTRERVKGRPKFLQILITTVKLLHSLHISQINERYTGCIMGNLITLLVFFNYTLQHYANVNLKIYTINNMAQTFGELL